MLRIRILLLGLLLFGIAGLASAQQDFVVGPLTAQAPACPVSPGQQSQSTSALTLATVNYGGATFTIGASAFSGTVSFFGSGDGALTWQPLNVFPSNSTTPVTTATAAGVWQVNVAAYTNVCMVFTTATSGTVTATIRKATVSARAGGGGGGGAAPVFPQTVSGTVTSGGIPYFNSTTSESSSGILNAGVLVQGGGAGGAPTNSLCDNGVTTANTLTCTDTSGIAAPGFIGTGTGAGFDALVQGADNCVAKQPAGSVCWEAPASGVTSYHGLYAVTPSTGIPHYSYSAPTITETISLINLAADVTGALPIGNVGSSGLSGTAPVTISAAGAIACATCTTSAAAITNNVLPKGSGGAQGLQNSLATDDGTTLAYTGTGGIESPVFEATGGTAGFWTVSQGTTSAAVDPCNLANSKCFQAPAALTANLETLAPATAQGTFAVLGNAAATTEMYSGDANHSTTVSWSTATTLGSTPLCSAANCPVGTYVVHAYIDVTTACTTTGSYVVSIIWTDDTTVSKTSVIPFDGLGFTTTFGPAAITSTFVPVSTTDFGTGVFVLRSTGATSINYSTTAVACGTGGPGVGKLYLSVVPVQ